MVIISQTSVGIAYLIITRLSNKVLNLTQLLSAFRPFLFGRLAGTGPHIPYPHGTPFHPAVILGSSWYHPAFAAEEAEA